MVEPLNWSSGSYTHRHRSGDCPSRETPGSSVTGVAPDVMVSTFAAVWPELLPAFALVPPQAAAMAEMPLIESPAAPARASASRLLIGRRSRSSIRLPGSGAAGLWRGSFTRVLLEMAAGR